MNLAADKLCSAAVGWFKRLRQTDDLSRLVRAASGTSVHLSRDEVSNLRSLLTKEQTWRMIAGGKLNEKLHDLIGQIVGCLPPRDGRTVEDAREAASAIARGLLEFAVYDLQPGIFQKVVLARLEQMTDQASALDTALVRMHGDLYHLVGEAKDLFRQVMDRLPPGPAGLSEIRIYLKTLISWLNNDPWPRDQRLGGPVLTPAAIERKLRVSGTASAHEHDAESTGHEQDADELVRKCTRLVILGGPGSGKTWLAKRSARICAEEALQALAEHAALDEVQLPLYSTFSQLLSASGDIRHAAVSSALERIGDLGGSRLTAALVVFFTERNAPTMLVIDSLDETHGPNHWLHEVGSLPPTWRIILTSRPSSWDHRLFIEDGNESHRVGELQPLRYPGDVEAVIRSWFRKVPDRGQHLAAQIAQRRGLQETATVPLILAFYCIISGSEPLPEFRHDLFSRVLRRMLTGLWRDSSVPPQGLKAALRTLRDWAWAGAACDPLSEVGLWADEIATEPSGPGETDYALDNVATPLGPPDVDTGVVWRRFVHRSLREHLVAEFVAGFPVESAAEALLPHLWYDTDWEYAVPTAIAMHDHPDQLLRALIRRITMSDCIPDDVSALDAGWEIRQLFARVAAETREDVWSPAIVAAIAQARVQLARSGRTDDLAGAWESSNRQVREVLLAQLADQTSASKDGEAASRLASAIARLTPAAEDRRRARETLLKLLSSSTIYEQLAAELVGVMIQLAPTAHEKRHTRDSLLSLLAGEGCRNTATLVGGTVQLADTIHDKHQVRRALLGLMVHQNDGRVAAQLAGGVVQLAPTARDKRQAREALLGLLAHQVNGLVAVELVDSLSRTTPTAEDRRQARGALLGLLASQTDHKVGVDLVRGVIQLAPTAHDKHQAREVMLELLADQTDFRVGAELVCGVIQLARQPHDKRQVYGRMAAEEVGGVVQFASGTQDDHRIRRARETLFTLLAGQTGNGPSFDRRANKLVDGVVHLAATAHDKRHASQGLLGLLAGLSDPYGDHMAAKLVDGVVHLAVTTQDKRHARQALLGLLADQDSDGVAAELVNGLARMASTVRDRRETREALLKLLPGHASLIVARRLVYGLAGFAPTAQDQRQAREALVGLLARSTDRFIFSQMVGQVVQLAPTAQGQRQARKALLGLLTSQADSYWRCCHARLLVEGLTRLAPTAGDRQRARETLLGLLPNQTDSCDAAFLACGLAQLAVTTQQKRQASGIIVRLLVSETNSYVAKELACSLVQVGPENKDRHQALEALVGLLADETGSSWAGHPASCFVELAVTAEDKRHTREALVGLLNNHDNVWAALRLADGLTRLAPTVRDKRLARNALLKLLPRHLDSHAGSALVDMVVQLAPAARDKRQPREALLGLLADQARGWRARDLVDAVCHLAPTAQDQRQAREALLGLLTGDTEDGLVQEIVGAVVQLAPSAQGKRQAREALLGRLHDLFEDARSYALDEELLGGVARLSPTADDLITLTGWWIQPPAELLAAARPNSPVANWLTAVRGGDNHTDRKCRTLAGMVERPWPARRAGSEVG